MANFWIAQRHKIILYIEAMLAKDSMSVPMRYIQFAINHNRQFLQADNIQYDRQELIEGCFLHCRYLFYSDANDQAKMDSAAQRYNRWKKSMTG